MRVQVGRHTFGVNCLEIGFLVEHLHLHFYGRNHVKKYFQLLNDEKKGEEAISQPATRGGDTSPFFRNKFGKLNQLGPYATN